MINCPRLIISGLGGDTGKTLVSVGLCRLLSKKYKVTPFKKGPDYIDMEWLTRGAQHPCYNLDLFLMSKEKILESFCMHTRNSDIAIVEGNRGLYDGMDDKGSVSTAELAKLLRSPVILVVNCKKVTRTVSALVFGCQMFDKEVSIKGVILNNLATSRHETIIRKSVEDYCSLPVIGAIPRLKYLKFPGRHLGLVPPQENPMAEEAINTAADIVEKYLDLDKLYDIACNAPAIIVSPTVSSKQLIVSNHLSLGMSGDQKNDQYPTSELQFKIGVIRDSAFQFYYQENLDALKKAGATLIEFNALKDDLPDDIEGLYIGGGFPETHAELLVSNKSLREAIRNAGEEGLPIYAECGGLMYLAEELIWEGKRYPMVGLLPIIVDVQEKPQGHGYTIIEVDVSNPYFKKGDVLQGHEFHYSRVVDFKKRSEVFFSFRMKKGVGIRDGFDGICYKNILATYTHLHALGTKEWVDGIMNIVKNYKKNKIITLG